MNPDFLTGLAPEVAILVALLWYIDRKDKRQEARDVLLSESFSKLAKAIDRNTSQTESNEAYLRERNGRDAEMHKQVLDELKLIEGRVKGA